MKVSVKKIEGYTVLVYRYKAGDINFCFHLLSEVGEPWQDDARVQVNALCIKHNCKVSQVELSSEPWYVDALVSI